MSDGATLLRGFLERHGITQLAAADALDVSDPTIHDWCKGTKRPRTHHRDALAVWTSGEVPAASWLKVDEAEKMANVRPFVPRDESTRDLDADESGEHSAVPSPRTA